MACEACDLHKTRKRVVLYRGSLPCDILYIGEAPGKTENLLGKPFIGRSGKLLDKMTEEAYRQANLKPSYGITNVLGCIPWGIHDDGYKGVRPPTTAEAEACQPRLLETIKAASPVAVVLLGKSAEAYANLFKDLPVLKLQHPAYILRNGGAGETYTRFVVYLRDFLIEQLKPESST